MTVGTVVNWNVLVGKSRLFAGTWFSASPFASWTIGTIVVGLATPRPSFPKCLYLFTPYGGAMLSETAAYWGDGYSSATRGITGIQYSQRIAALPATPAREGMIRAGSPVADPITGALVAVPVIIVGPDAMGVNAISTGGSMGWRATMDDVICFNEPYGSTISIIRAPGDIASIGGVDYVKFGNAYQNGTGLWVKETSDV
jgi:hypothetical protein